MSGGNSVMPIPETKEKKDGNQRNKRESTSPTTKQSAVGYGKKVQDAIAKCMTRGKTCG